MTKTLAPPPSETEEDEDEGDEDEDDEEDQEATPAPSRGRGQGDATKAQPSKVREAEKSDAEIDDLLDGEIQHDSIMDSSEEEDADEVDDLLG